MHIRVNPMIIAKKMNHGIFGIIDFFFGGGEPIWRAESWRNIEGKLWEKLYKRK